MQVLTKLVTFGGGYVLGVISAIVAVYIGMWLKDAVAEYFDDNDYDPY